MTENSTDTRTPLVKAANDAKLLAIVGIFFAGIILGPIAIVQGNRLMAKMRTAKLDESAIAIAKTAKTLGIVAAVLHVVTIVVVIIVVAVAAR